MLFFFLYLNLNFMTVRAVFCFNHYCVAFVSFIFATTTTSSAKCSLKANDLLNRTDHCSRLYLCGFLFYDSPHHNISLMQSTVIKMHSTAYKYEIMCAQESFTHSLYILTKQQKEFEYLLISRLFNN